MTLFVYVMVVWWAEPYNAAVLNALERATVAIDLAILMIGSLLLANSPDAETAQGPSYSSIQIVGSLALVGLNLGFVVAVIHVLRWHSAYRRRCCSRARQIDVPNPLRRLEGIEIPIVRIATTASVEAVPDPISPAKGRDAATRPAGAKSPKSSGT